MKPIEKFYFNSFDGTRLAAYRFGEGTPIILLHGLFSSAEMNWIKWDHHAKIAKAGFEVVMLDFRAHGSSASPTDPKNYPLNVLVQDTATLLNHLGIRDFFLGGFSLGARTSIHAVANEILDPKGLIIAGMGIEGLSSWNKRAIHFKRIIDDFDFIGPDDPDWMSRQFLKSQKIDRVAARHLLDTMPNVELSTLENIKIPTLVICGDNDSDNGSGKALADLLPCADFVETPGNHLMSATKPEMGDQIRLWLQEKG